MKNWTYVMLMNPNTSRRMESNISLNEEPEGWLKIDRIEFPLEPPIDYFRIGINENAGEAYFVVGCWLKSEVIGGREISHPDDIDNMFEI